MISHKEGVNKLEDLAQELRENICPSFYPENKSCLGPRENCSCVLTFRTLGIVEESIPVISKAVEALDDARSQAGEVAIMLLQNDHEGALQWARDVSIEFKTGDGAPRLHVEVERIRTERDDAMKYAAGLQKAVEFGGYLATSADGFLEVCNALHAAREKAEDDDAGDAAHEALEAAKEVYSEHYRGLRENIHEFEKRRDRALAKNPADGGQRYGGFDSRSLAESRCEKAGSNPADSAQADGLVGTRGLTAGKDPQPNSSHSPYPLQGDVEELLREASKVLPLSLVTDDPRLKAYGPQFATMLLLRSALQPHVQRDESAPGVYPAGGRWLIFYEDQDVQPEHFSDERAARHRLTQAATNWNCHLYARIGTTARDTITPEIGHPK